MNTMESDLDRDLLRIARVKVMHTDGAVHVRLTGFSPFMMFLTTLIIGIVVGGFAYPITAMLYHPQPVPPGLIIGAATVLVVLAVLLAIRKHVALKAGDRDLTIASDRGVLILPASLRRTVRKTIDFQQVRAIAPADERELLEVHALDPRRYGRWEIVPDKEVRDIGSRSSQRSAVVIDWLDGAEVVSELIVRWIGRRRTNAFAHWLCRQLWLPTGLDDETSVRP